MTVARRASLPACLPACLPVGHLARPLRLSGMTESEKTANRQCDLFRDYSRNSIGACEAERQSTEDRRETKRTTHHVRPSVRPSERKKKDKARDPHVQIRQCKFSQRESRRCDCITCLFVCVFVCLLVCLSLDSISNRGNNTRERLARRSETQKDESHIDRVHFVHRQRSIDQMR